MAEKSRNCRL